MKDFQFRRDVKIFHGAGLPASMRVERWPESVDDDTLRE